MSSLLTIQPQTLFQQKRKVLHGLFIFRRTWVIAWPSKCWVRNHWSSFIIQAYDTAPVVAMESLMDVLHKLWDSVDWVLMGCYFPQVLRNFINRWIYLHLFLYHVNRMQKVHPWQPFIPLHWLVARSYGYCLIMVITWEILLWLLDDPRYFVHPSLCKLHCSSENQRDTFEDLLTYNEILHLLQDQTSYGNQKKYCRTLGHSNPNPRNTEDLCSIYR